MQIKAAKIKTFRTIKDEIEIPIANGVTIVGANNTGKTNLLRGIRLFFTGHENELGYSRHHDLSFDQAPAQTNISMTFSLSDDVADQEIIANLSNVRRLLGVVPSDKSDNSELTVYLTFSLNSKPSYRVYPNLRRPNAPNTKVQYSRLEKKLVESILDSFSVHYIPSEKSTTQLYQELVTPFLKRQLFISIQPHLHEMKNAMRNAAAALDKALQDSGLSGLSCDFSVPEHPDRFFREVDFSIKDPNLTGIASKGMGIQSTALLAAFSWITEEEKKSGKNVLWLLEEPEAYLHPQLATQCRNLIQNISTNSQIVTTTHSLSFVPDDPKRIIGTELASGWTVPKYFKTYIEATSAIRQSLGVRFSDFYNLDRFNIFVEGETDRDYLDYMLKRISQNTDAASNFPLLCSKRLAILDFGGVRGIEGFLRATYQMIRAERACVAMLDGDAAGDKCRRDLQGFFGEKKIPFEANDHFIVVRDRFAIEGLFPDEWILTTHATHRQWFEDFSVDSAGALQPFSIHKNSKKSFASAMFARADREPNQDWMDRWISLFKALEKGLSRQSERLYNEVDSQPQTDKLEQASAADNTTTGALKKNGPPKLLVKLRKLSKNSVPTPTAESDQKGKAE
ncbi:ATP-binding protein [Roseomonas stagni]|uniref:ATP-binding protein n=1 Tax=Falsiroseomonas algicola TaxID=2716930 RepID=A0A6M1LVA2_9PROT|nr:AAA family ATPase [Falsiroseomonas algicola]NGM23932.1 ATP-binding protein [Falsiroseomonas algicola]